MRVFDYKFDHKNRPENFSPSRFLLPSSPFFLVIFKVERTQKQPGLYCSRYFPRVVFVVTSTENNRVKNFPVDFCGRIYGRTRAQNDRSIFQSLVRSMNPLGYTKRFNYYYRIWFHSILFPTFVMIYDKSIYYRQAANKIRRIRYKMIQ